MRNFSGNPTYQELSEIVNYAAMRVAVCSTTRGRESPLADVLIIIPLIPMVEPDEREDG